jgi:ribose 5-phosphate isomerase B
MRLAIASDHAGFPLKEEVRKKIEEEGRHAVIDCGVFSEDRSDYPDAARSLALTMQKGDAERGILVCGSGIGMCMAANRYPFLRAVVLHDADDAEMSRRHNDANVACFAGRRLDLDRAWCLLEVFLSTPFEGGRHEARIAKLARFPEA